MHKPIGVCPIFQPICRLNIQQCTAPVEDRGLVNPIEADHLAGKTAISMLKREFDAGGLSQKV